MNSRERLLTVLRGGIPDYVPVAPDFSNMIPARLTGKPFWDLYLYNDPPIWEAYIDCAKHFDIDSLMDGYFPLQFPHEIPDGPEHHACIVFENEERIVTQTCWMEDGKRHWMPHVTVYYRADPPTWCVDPTKIGLPPEPKTWRPVEGVKPVDRGPESFAAVKKRLGNQGLIGVFVTSTGAIGNEAGVFRYYDEPENHEAWAEERVRAMDRRFDAIMAMPEKPDFLSVGGSGSFIMQTEEMFRTIAFPAVKRAIERATAAGMMTHVHCCGPESKLVEIMAMETGLTVIDPLEIPPMGDCNLADLKRRFGTKLTLKGNLHTTDVMLRGSVETVRAASRQAIDDAATGGRFILSTGDQCGRDTPDENLRVMVETARTYGRYVGDTPVGIRG